MRDRALDAEAVQAPPGNPARRQLLQAGYGLVASTAFGAAPTALAAPSFSRDLTEAPADRPALQAEPLIEGLSQPWSVAWLPDGRMLITEKTGALRLASADFKLSPQPIGQMPPILLKGQGGLFDVAVHPRYAQGEDWIYLSFSEPDAKDDRLTGTALIRAKLRERNGQLVLAAHERLFSMNPKTNTGYHFGGRIVFDGKGHVYLTLGDRGERERAQAAGDHAGSVIRLLEDGRRSLDNPPIPVAGGASPPDSFTRGNRNIQGAAIHPQTGELWAHEHGPQGGDEVNIIRGGKNYGWPTITYGVQYVTGTVIGEGTAKAGLEQPIHVWVPSIAPSGMAFYFEDKIPGWRGSLLVGALREQALIRLVLDGSRVVREERYFERRLGRIRDVRVGPDGWVYLLTDSSKGRLIRIRA